MEKQYITPQQLLADAYSLAGAVFDSGFRPSHIVGIWRGGTPVAIAVHEVLQVLGVESDHFAIRTQSYQGMGQREDAIRVDGLDYLRNRINPTDALLLVDDVYDSGLSLQQVVSELHELGPGNPPEIRLATPYFKPARNCTTRNPDYFVHQTDDWLVFPHELDGLTLDEMRENKPELTAVLPLLERRLQGSSK